MQAEFSYDPPSGPLKVIYSDDDLLVLDKPAGLLSVPGKSPAHSDCLETRAKAAFENALLVHRLDMDTSGIMVFAMNKAAQRHLGLQFERRKLEKTYQALIWGQMVDDQGSIDLPLIVDWPNRPLQKVDFETGKAALTKWRIVERAPDHCRINLYPHTGRSHQLRVHMLAIGHVILGDRFYADGPALAAAPRLCLHASDISLYHPTGGARVHFHAPCPF